MPVRVTDCGEVAMESVRVSLALNDPAAAGANATQAVQLVAGANVAGQLFREMNEVGFVPVKAIDEKTTAVPPLLVMVTL